MALDNNDTSANIQLTNTGTPEKDKKMSQHSEMELKDRSPVDGNSFSITPQLRPTPIIQEPVELSQLLQKEKVSRPYFTPEKEINLDNIVSERAEKIKSTPITTKDITEKHFENSENKMKNMEDSIIQDRIENNVIKGAVFEIMKVLENFQNDYKREMSDLNCRFDEMLSEFRQEKFTTEKLRQTLKMKDDTIMDLEKLHKEKMEEINVLKAVIHQYEEKEHKSDLTKSKAFSRGVSNTKSENDTRQVNETPVIKQNSNPSMGIVEVDQKSPNTERTQSNTDDSSKFKVSNGKGFIKDPSDITGKYKDPGVILISDSVGKYIDQRKFFGNEKVYLVKSPKSYGSKGFNIELEKFSLRENCNHSSRYQ